MYSNWFYLVGLPKVSKEMSSMFTEHWEASTLPYLFFWLRDFKIWFFTEAQIIVKDRKAEIHPIAGTLKEQVMMKRRNTSQRIIRRQKKEIANT
jgi:anthranilate/para-aminobenzoate synthase component I